MKLLKNIFLLMATSIFLQGCFTSSLHKKIEKNYQPKKEFAGSLGIESKSLIAKGHNTNIFKGKYLGEELKNTKTYGHLQFEGMLKGDNRVLDIHFDLDTNSFPEFYELKKMGKGLDAYLFLSESGFNGAMNRQYFGKPVEKIANPELLYDHANLDKTHIPDTCVIMGLYYSYDPGNVMTSEAIINIYTKKPDNQYSVKQMKAENVEKTGNFFHLNYISRNKTKKNLNKLMYALSVPADIITSPIQLLFHIIVSKIY